MKYEIAKHNAQQFANERNQPVYIARAVKIKKNVFCDFYIGSNYYVL